MVGMRANHLDPFFGAFYRSEIEWIGTENVRSVGTKVEVLSHLVYICLHKRVDLRTQIVVTDNFLLKV